MSDDRNASTMSIADRLQALEAQAQSVIRAFDGLGRDAIAFGHKAQYIGVIVREMIDAAANLCLTEGETPEHLSANEVREEMPVLIGRALTLLHRRVRTLPETSMANLDLLVHMVDKLYGAIHHLLVVQAGRESLHDAPPTLIALRQAVSEAEASQVPGMTSDKTREAVTAALDALCAAHELAQAQKPNMYNFPYPTCTTVEAVIFSLRQILATSSYNPRQCVFELVAAQHIALAASGVCSAAMVGRAPERLGFEPNPQAEDAFWKSFEAAEVAAHMLLRGPPEATIRKSD